MATMAHTSDTKWLKLSVTQLLVTTPNDSYYLGGSRSLSYLNFHIQLYADRYS